MSFEIWLTFTKVDNSLACQEIQLKRTEFPGFIEPEGSLQCSQKSAIGPNPGKLNIAKIGCPAMTYLLYRIL
jgi:hypothetical protein